MNIDELKRESKLTEVLEEWGYPLEDRKEHIWRSLQWLGPRHGVGDRHQVRRRMLAGTVVLVVAAAARHWRAHTRVGTRARGAGSGIRPTL